MLCVWFNLPFINAGLSTENLIFFIFIFLNISVLKIAVDVQNLVFCTICKLCILVFFQCPFRNVASNIFV